MTKPLSRATTSVSVVEPPMLQYLSLPSPPFPIHGGAREGAAPSLRPPSKINDSRATRQREQMERTKGWGEREGTFEGTDPTPPPPHPPQEMRGFFWRRRRHGNGRWSRMHNTGCLNQFSGRGIASKLTRTAASRNFRRQAVNLRPVPQSR